MAKKQKVTAKQLVERMRASQKAVDSGKLKGWPLQQAKNNVTSIRYRLKKLKSPKPVNVKTKKSSDPKIPLVTIKAKRKTKVAKSAPKHQFVQEQGFIPGFLKMMNMVKIEEMVAQKLFNEIKAQLEGLTAREVELAKVAEDINERMGAMQISFAGVRKAKKQA